MLPKLQVSLRSTPPHLSSKCTWSSNPVSLEIRHRVFSGFGASRKSWCQERALAAPVLPPDYILPKTYLRVGLRARVGPSGPFCVAPGRYGLASLSEQLKNQLDSRDWTHLVVVDRSHGFWGRYWVVLDCSGSTSAMHGRPGTVISMCGIRVEIPHIEIWSVKSSRNELILSGLFKIGTKLSF